MQELNPILAALWPLIIFQLALLALALFDLLRRKTVRFLPRWGWVLVICLVNLLGPIAYLVFGRGED